MTDEPSVTQTPPEGEPEKRPRRTVAEWIVLWIAKLAATGILCYAGYLKVSGHEADVELFAKLGMEPGGRLLIGALELLAGIMVLIPQSAIYGAFLGLGIMCGAVIGHLTVLPLDGIQYALFVALCCVTILYIRRHDAKFIRNLWDL